MYSIATGPPIILVLISLFFLLLSKYFPISAICQISTISLHGSKTTHTMNELESSVILPGLFIFHLLSLNQLFYPNYLLGNNANLKKKKNIFIKI